MPYRRALSDLFSRSAKGVVFDLEFIEALLEKLGRPQDSFKAILVAGTNGKGTTSALLAQVLMAPSRRVGLYTSPHLLRFVERIRIDGQEISDASAERHYRQVVAAEKGLARPATFFECTTAMAFLAFEEAGVATAVLEVGLGGRLDATNIMPQKNRLLSVITPIAFDHQAILGKTLKAIANEKARIFRPGVRAVVAPQTASARRVLVDYAEQIQTPLTLMPRGFVAAEDAEAHLLGWPSFLADNARLVWACLPHLTAAGLRLRPKAFVDALKHFSWPGRFTFLPKQSADMPDVVLDCAHNVSGAQALAQSLREDPRLANRRCFGIASAVEDKDLRGILKATEGQLQSCVLCALKMPRARSKKDLGRFGAAYDDFAAAWRATLSQTTPNDVVVIFGSIFLISAALIALTDAPHDPPVRG